MYTLIESLPDQVTIQADSIVSRQLLKNQQMTVILFGFDTDQELSEHTSSHTAVIHILQGEATVTLGADTHELSAGGLVHMPPHLPHSIHAHTPLIMLLTMIT